MGKSVPYPNTMDMGLGMGDGYPTATGLLAHASAVSLYREKYQV